MSGSLPSGPEAPALRPGHFEGISDERLEAELRAAGLLVSGSGGVGTHGPDWSGGGGGDGDGWDDEEWPRRHHSRAVRVTALAFASLLVLGTAGAWVSLAIDVSRMPFPATVTLVSARTPASDESASAAGSFTTAAPARTAFTLSVSLTNRSGGVATPECLLLVDAAGHEAEPTVTLRPLANGANEAKTVTVVVPGAPATVPMTDIACAAR